MAGLWKNDIHVGLTWYTHGHYQEDCAEENFLPNRAPSWSWACSNRGFTFRSDTRNHYKDLGIAPISTTPKGLDPFVELSGGTPCVNGVMNKGVVALNIIGDGNYIDLILHDYKNTNTAIAQLYVDSAHLFKRMKEDSSQRKEVICLLVSYDLSDYNKWVGLALEQIKGTGERIFQRIGVIVCHKMYEAGYGWFNGCKRECIKIN